LVTRFNHDYIAWLNYFINLNKPAYGSLTILSVSAASVLAKVSRDRMMREYANDYSLWSFETNKGYPCPKHRTALQGYGPSALHRTSWAFMENFVPWLGRSTLQPHESQSQLEFQSA
jgi:ribonuclease HII